MTKKLAHGLIGSFRGLVLAFTTLTQKQWHDPDKIQDEPSPKPECRFFHPDTWHHGCSRVLWGFGDLGFGVVWGGEGFREE